VLLESGSNKSAVEARRRGLLNYPPPGLIRTVVVALDSGVWELWAYHQKRKPPRP